MAYTFQRLMAAPQSLDPGQYTVQTETCRACLRCVWCGLNFDLPRHVSVDATGRTDYAVKCPEPSCPFFEWVVLADIWSDP